MDVASSKHSSFSQNIFMIIEILKCDKYWPDHEVLWNTIAEHEKSYLHPDISGLVIILDTLVTVMSRLRHRLC